MYPNEIPNSRKKIGLGIHKKKHAHIKCKQNNYTVKHSTRCCFYSSRLNCCCMQTTTVIVYCCCFFFVVVLYYHCCCCCVCDIFVVDQFALKRTHMQYICWQLHNHLMKASCHSSFLCYYCCCCSFFFVLS